MKGHEVVLLIASIIILSVSTGVAIPLPKCTATACTPELLGTAIMIGFGLGLLAMFVFLHMDFYDAPHYISHTAKGLVEVS